MLRYQARALRLLVQFQNYSPEVNLPEKKSTARVHKFSTKANNEWILNRIYKLTTNELRTISPNEWLDRINVLRSFYFSESQSLRMLSQHPDLLHLPTTNLEITLRQWFLADFGQENIIHILHSNPVLLDVDYLTIRQRLPMLLKFGSSKVIAELLFHSPQVMLDDWTRVLMKINYLMTKRGFSMKAIIDSRALLNSYEFILFRFDLLEKCGMYRQMTLIPHKINKYDKSIRQNPSLIKILHPNDEVFSQKVAKISVEEYNVCYELFKNDYEESNDSDDEDDSDSESDSD